MLRLHGRLRFKLHGGDHIKRIRLRIAAASIPCAAAVMSVMLSLSTAGCGYRMAGQSTSLPESIRTLAITMFENDSFEPNIEETVTRGVIDQFVNDGRLRIVPLGKADAELTGTVKNYVLEPVAWNILGYVTVYTVRLDVQIEFRDLSGNGFNISQFLKVQSSYSLEDDIAVAEGARQVAIESASSILGDTLIGILLEGF
ncbi:MAG: hypothetical protein IEMM0002_1083 [bacterium]|nr:MAG: hypothetical protein IEMM0002_1083 [bacterium]